MGDKFEFDGFDLQYGMLTITFVNAIIPRHSMHWYIASI